MRKSLLSIKIKQQYVNGERQDVQAGFRKDRGTRDQIANIHWQQSSRKTSTSALLTMPKRLTMWITTNYGKFFEVGIPDHLTYILRNLYAGQEATIRTGHGTTDWFQIGKGVHQCCILSPCLINLYPSCEMLGWMKHSWNQDCQEKYQ